MYMSASCEKCMLSLNRASHGIEDLDGWALVFLWPFVDGKTENILNVIKAIFLFDIDSKCFFDCFLPDKFVG